MALDEGTRPCREKEDDSSPNEGRQFHPNPSYRLTSSDVDESDAFLMIEQRHRLGAQPGIVHQ